MNIVSFIRTLPSIKVKINSPSMLRLLSIGLLLTIVCSSESRVRRRQNHQIDWISSNSVFQSTPAVVTVRLGDTIDFLCPHYNQSGSSIEYNTIYLVSEIDYNLCFTENYQPLIRCDQPIGEKRLVYTISFSKYLPYPNMPEFTDGQSYYFISTSNGDSNGLNQKYDGLCREKNLRLIVDVQKYYRRYSISDHRHSQSRTQKYLINHSFQPLMSSNGDRSRSSLFSICVGLVLFAISFTHSYFVH